MAADRVLLDTNVLVAATDADRPEHAAALELLNTGTERSIPLYATTQVMREYLVVVSRSSEANGLGLAIADAISNVTAFGQRLQVIADDGRVWDRLMVLLSDIPVAGKRIHDANIVATALTHGIGQIVTLNVGDFARFTDVIDIRGLWAS